MPKICLLIIDPLRPDGKAWFPLNRKNRNHKNRVVAVVVTLAI